MLSLIALWFFTIGLFGLGFTWPIGFADCSGKRQYVLRLMDRQDDFLLNYLDKRRQTKRPDNLFSPLAGMKTLIEKREDQIKLKIEHFKEDCRSRRNRATLSILLNQYRSYLYLKQETLKEKQNFS